MIRKSMDLITDPSIQTLFNFGMDRDIPRIRVHAGSQLNIGCGNKHIEGAYNLDYPEWDADANKPLPFPDDLFGMIHCYHFLEHCTYPTRVLRDLQRVLAPGGVLNICVPYYRSALMAQDLDHKRSFNEDTWKTLFSNPYYDKDHGGWRFEIGLNIIIGIAERNLCLLTQLIKKGA